MNQKRHPRAKAREEIYEDPYAAKLQSPLYRFFDRIWFLVKLHVAMVLGTGAGLVVFGFFPSLFAAAELCNDSIEHGEGKLFKPFLTLWKKHFKRANLFALVIYAALGIGFAVWYLLWYLRQPFLATMAYILFFLAGLALLIVLLYYPVLRLFFKRWSAWKTAGVSVLFGFGHFASTLLLLVIVAAWTLFALLVPQFAVFLLFSIIPWAAVVVTRRLLPLDQTDDPEPNDSNMAYTSYPSATQQRSQQQ